MSVSDVLESHLWDINVQHQVTKTGHEPLHWPHLLLLVSGLKILPDLKFGLVPLCSKFPLLVQGVSLSPTVTYLLIEYCL